LTTQIQKKYSKKLEQLLADLGPDFGKLETKIDVIFEQGRKEGFSDIEIGDLARSKMNEHYSDRTIRRVLPDTAKHIEKVREQKDFADNLSANEREPVDVPAGKVTVEPVIEEDAAIPQSQPELQMEQPILALSAQPGPKEVKGRYNIAPEEHEMDHLEEYDKDLLIRIIKYLRVELEPSKEVAYQSVLADAKKDLTKIRDIENGNKLIKEDLKELEKIHKDLETNHRTLEETILVENKELKTENTALKKENEKLKKDNAEFMRTLANDVLEFGKIENENDALKKEIELLHNRLKT